MGTTTKNHTKINNQLPGSVKNTAAFLAMSFRTSHLGTRHAHTTKKYAWQCKHTVTSVKRATPRTNALPSYSMGSSSVPKTSDSTVVRHHNSHGVSLSHHNPKRVQMIHNGPLPEHAKAIASPRHKARRGKSFDLDEFSLNGTSTSRPQTAPSSGRTALEPTNDGAVSAETRAHVRRQEMASKAAAKKQRAAQFQMNLKKRLAKRVKKQRQEAANQSKTWMSLEAKSKQKAAEWVDSEISPDSLLPNSRSITSPESRAPRPLQNHLQNITANSQKARAAMLSRSSLSSVTPPPPSPSLPPPTTTRSRKSLNASKPTIKKKDKKERENVGTTSKNSKNQKKSKWKPDMSLHGGMINTNSINKQSQTHLVVAVRKAEAKAQRVHAQRYRKDLRRKARMEKREEEKESLRALQDSRVEESRQANETAREEYEDFLKAAKDGVSEMAFSTRSKLKREENVNARYVVALRENLHVALNSKGLHVPNLCACVQSEGATGDYHTNNCQFYQDKDTVSKMTHEMVGNLRDSAM